MWRTCKTDTFYPIWYSQVFQTLVVILRYCVSLWKTPYAPMQDYTWCLVDRLSSCSLWVATNGQNSLYRLVLAAIGTCAIGIATEVGTDKLQNCAFPLWQCQIIYPACLVKDTIWWFGWETFCHSPYLPDYALSNYDFFHSMDNYLHRKSFSSEADIRQALTLLSVQNPKVLP